MAPQNPNYAKIKIIFNFMTQQEALDILKTGRSVFLTGAAGTGKTFVLNQYIQYLKSHAIYPVITASTGIAATHLGGQTIHSWSGIGIYEKFDSLILEKLKQNKTLLKRYKSISILILDEISMLHASRLDMINILFKTFLKKENAFSEIQVIFCGDFFQLPPVIRGEGAEINEKYLAYSAKTWEELNPIICYLTENYRQEKDELNDLLNDIRLENNMPEIYERLFNKISENNKLENDLEKNILSEENLEQNLNKIKDTNEVKEVKEIIKLYTHNMNVDIINLEKYHSLNKNGVELIFEMKSFGKANVVANLKASCLALEILKLKVGTKVIFIRNDLNQKYQNGTLAEIIGFDILNMPIVKTFSGEEFAVTAETWEYMNEDGNKLIASISQIPLRYAWAITIHKSQGMTLDEAEIDLSKAFGSGMGYVALSRVKKLANIKLLGLHPQALKINNSVLKKDNVFKEKSLKTEKVLQKYYQEILNSETREINLIKNKILTKKHDDFILKCGGDLRENSITEK